MPRILQGPLRRALIVEKPHADLDRLLTQAGVEVVRIDASPDEDELIELIQQHRPQLLYKRSRVPVTRRVLEAAEDLVAIQLCCIGHDSIDMAAAAERGILVFNDPVSNGRSVVELVIAEMISMARRLDQAHDEARQGIWLKSSGGRYEIAGKRLGIVGLGKIGRAVARVCDLLGMEIAFFDNRMVAQEVGEEMGWTSAESLDALFRSSDIVTLHTSAHDFRGRSNEGLLSRETLCQLGADRPESSPRLLLNLARGVLYRAEDLLHAVESGVIRLATVDVYPSEPSAAGPGWENPYADERRILCTPHIGAATQEAQPRIARRVAGTSIGYSTTGSVRDCVFSPMTKVSFGEGLHAGQAVLVVLHTPTRGTKKALDDAIYEAEAENLRSQHRDFPRHNLALEVAQLDRALSSEQLARIVEHTTALTGDPNAVRLIRQVTVEG